MSGRNPATLAITRHPSGNVAIQKGEHCIVLDRTELHRLANALMNYDYDAGLVPIEATIAKVVEGIDAS